MTVITRDLMKDIRVDMNDALTSVAKKYGVSIQVGNGSFSPSEGTYKVSILSGEGKTIASTKADKQAFDLEAARVIHKNVDFDREYTFSGKKYTIVGYRGRAPKNPFIIQQVGGDKQYATSEDSLTTQI